MLFIRGAVIRELLRFYRQRSRIITTLVTPLFFLVLMGSGLKASFPNVALPEGVGFAAYFFPGIVLLTVLFASIFSSISVIEDRNEGFLQSVIVAPVSSFSLVAGKVVGGAMVALLQGLIFLLLAPAIGISFTLASLGLTLLVLVAVSLALSALGFFFAWKLDSSQGFHGIMNLVLFPMWLLSGTFFPLENAPVWLKPVIWINPLSYAYQALQVAFYQGVSNPTYWIGLGVTVGFGLILWCLSARLVSR